MNEDLYEEKLAWFKRTERPEAVLVVADDPGRIKVAAAWTNLEIRRAEKLTGLRGESENDLWRWLWQNKDHGKTQKEIPGERSGHSARLFCG